MQDSSFCILLFNREYIYHCRNEDFAVPSTSNFPLPLPAPSESTSFNDFSGCNNFEEVEPDSYASDLEALFSRNETETDISGWSFFSLASACF